MKMDNKHYHSRELRILEGQMARFVIIVKKDDFKNDD